MESHLTLRPKGRVPKRPRSKNELTELAQRLGADWQHGDNVMTWIRRHEATGAELSRLVRDGWSWTDLGRALALAGIKYQTSPAIPGDLLRRKAGKARADKRKRQAAEALHYLPAAPEVQASMPPLSEPPMPAAAISPAVSTAPEMKPLIEDEEPAFKPATLIRHSASKLPETRPQLGKERAPARVVDVDAVLARFTGRK
jgi:hypothetical protein